MNTKAELFGKEIQINENFRAIINQDVVTITSLSHYSNLTKAEAQRFSLWLEEASKELPDESSS